MRKAGVWMRNRQKPQKNSNSSGYSPLPVNKKELYPRTSFSSPPLPLSPPPAPPSLLIEEGEWNRGSAARSSAHWPVLAFLCWQERQHGSVETRRAGERRRTGERERGGSVCRWSAAGGRGGRGGASERASDEEEGGREPVARRRERETERGKERRRLAVC